MDWNANQKATLHRHIVQWLGGPDAYDELRQRGLRVGKVDYEAVIKELEGK